MAVTISHFFTILKNVSYCHSDIVATIFEKKNTIRKYKYLQIDYYSIVPIFDLIFQSLSPMSYIYIIPSLVYEIKNCKLSMLFEVKNQFNKTFSLSSLSLHCTRHKNKTIIIGTITHITLKQNLKFYMANLYIYNLALGRPDNF